MSPPPIPYVRVFNFNNFSENYPSAQQPGLQLDGEYNAVNVTLTSIIARLAEIQRPDGALANKIVTLDAMSPQVLTLVGGWNPRGDWVTLATYAYKDVAIRTGLSYVCLVPHVAGVFATDLAAGKWALISPVGISIDGTSVITADIPFNNHKITGLAPGVAGTDAATVTQVATAKTEAIAAAAAAIPAATEAVSGMIQLSTDPEGLAGVDDTTAMSPLKTKNAINARAADAAAVSLGQAADKFATPVALVRNTRSAKLAAFRLNR